MPIRTKILILIVTVNLLSYSILYGSVRFLLSNHFKSIEVDTAVKELHGVEITVDNIVKGLTSVIKDWAIWDDTYNFMKDPTQDYIDSNITPDVFQNLNIDYIVFLKENRDVAHAYMFNENTQEVITEVDDKILDDIKNSIFSGGTLNTYGIITVNGSPAYYGANYILPSEGNAASRGVMLMAKNSTKKEIGTLSHLTNLRIDGIKIADLSSKQKNIVQTIQNGKDNVLEISGNQITVNGILKNLDNSPAMLISFSIARDINAGAVRLGWYLVILFIFLMACSTLVWISQMDKLIFAKFNRLIVQMDQLRLAKSFDKKLKVDGYDEIADLTKHFNGILTSLSEAEKLAAKANEDLKAKASELEKKSAEISKINQFMIGRELRMSQLKKEIDNVKTKDIKDNDK